MPQRPLKPCLQPGCPELIPGGGNPRCSAHQKKKNQEQHNSFYDSVAWKNLRAWYRDKHPFCRECELNGDVRLGEEVDHVVPISEGGVPLDPNNLQNLCRTHHSQKTRREMAARARQ